MAVDRREFLTGLRAASAGICAASAPAFHIELQHLRSALALASLLQVFDSTFGLISAAPATSSHST